MGVGVEERVKGDVREINAWQNTSSVEKGKHEEHAFSASL